MHFDKSASICVANRSNTKIMENDDLYEPRAAHPIIYVGGLSEDVSSMDLRQELEAFGSINNFLRTTPGFALIRYAKLSSAVNVIRLKNGGLMCGHSVSVILLNIEPSVNPPTAPKKVFSH